MRRLLGIFSVLLLLGMGACMNHMTRSDGKNKTEKKENFQYVHVIPDSILTPDQLELKKKLMGIQLEYVVIEKNKFVLKLDRKDFIERGIPEEYYDLWMKNLKDNNRFIRKNKINNIDSMYKVSVLQSRQALN